MICLSDATGISTEVLLTSITAQRGIQGGTNKVLTVIDTHDELREDSIQTLGYELDHIRGGKNETLADLAGLAAKLNTDAAIIANQDTINPIKAQLGDGKDTQTTAQNQALLEGNDKTFAENHDGREGEWEYEVPHGAGGRGGGMPMGGATGAGFAIGGGATIVNNARQSASNQQSRQTVAKSDLNGPYNPQKTRQNLESVHGAENVKSTTVVLNPRQTVSSTPSYTLLRDGYGGKAVRVQYKDPITGESKTANIPYDSRGLPIFDDVSKVTVKIEKPQGHAILTNESRRRQEIINATL